MQSLDQRLIFSATDLSDFLGCPHHTLLDRRTAEGGPKPPYFDNPTIEVLRKRGLEHETAYLARLEAQGRRVVRIDRYDDEPSYERRRELRIEATRRAVRDQADVIYQGALFDGTWLGYPDFLEWNPDAGTYDVVDTKLAREAKGGALLQVLLYADLLAHEIGKPPERVKLALGGPDTPVETFRVADYAAYFRSIKRRFVDHVRNSSRELPVAVDPVEHCSVCDWAKYCDDERREVDHLSLVAGITRAQRRILMDAGIDTVEALAARSLDEPVGGIGSHAFVRIREQARIQVEGRRAGKHVHELLLPIEPGQGLAALPEPSPMDLFFDLEGDPHAHDNGLEYLFGFVDRDGKYVGRWALKQEGERAAFEEFIDLVMQRLEADPGMHIYHYAAYERTALQRLMGRYATREEEMDRLLRGDVLVDLHRVVKQSLRASVESYSIKKLEPLYGFTRAEDLRQAGNALAHFEAWLELGPDTEAGKELLESIERYNCDDCLSTLRLGEWLESLRTDLVNGGTEVPRPDPPKDDRDEEARKIQEEIRALMERLLEGVPDDVAARTDEQQARWVVAQLLEYHRRENKSFWWEYFRCIREVSDDEAIEDRSTLGGLEYVGEVGTVKRSVIHRYRFPPQDHGITGEHVHDKATQASPGRVVAIDDVHGTIDLIRGASSRVPHPKTLVPYDHVPDKQLRQSIQRIATEVAENGFGGDNAFGCAVDLLLARAPRAGQLPGEPLVRQGDELVEKACSIVSRLEHSVLAIQGPPGAGKTYTAARMIVSELKAGRRVGVTATSHKVIGNLLAEVCKAAQEAGVEILGIQKCDEDQWCKQAPIVATDSNDEVRAALGQGTRLAAGTAWLWSREQMVDSVDVLVVDEAGQFSLANALAVAPATKSLVLVGDPRQLEQPQQGVHPPGTDVSALDHLLKGHATIPEDRGIFLPTSWRLHPDICAFTSELYYDGRLSSLDGLDVQCIEGAGPLNGSGLRIIPVPHTGNDSESIEEARVVAQLVLDLVENEPYWRDGDGTRRRVTLEDVLVVAPYNAQVALIAALLPENARVGTVDKFQGQQAPVVIYSTASSSAADAPRGMRFLYSPNRLNVATSRAKCLAVVVASPALFVPECRTPEQMRLANGFCRFAELAGGSNIRKREAD